MIFSFAIFLCQVVFQFAGLFLLIIADAELEFSLLGPQHHRLPFHPAHHVKRRAWLPAQRHFQKVFLDPSLEGFAQFALDFKVAVRRTEPANALVRLAVIIVFDPKLDPLPRGLKTLELRPHQEVLPDGRPEALHFPQGHGVLRTRLDMDDVLLLHLRLKPAGAPPGGILRAVVGEHFLGRLIFPGRHPVNFDYRPRGRAAEQVRAHHET